VILLTSGQTKESLFKDGILFIPQRDRKTEALVIIRNFCNTIFSSPIGTGASLVMGKVILFIVQPVD
jgi:hypothetical protein